MEPEETVSALWRLFDQGRFEDMRPLLADAFVAEWPQTRERIAGPENFIQLNRAYPGRWRCHLRDMVVAGDRIVTEVEISDGERVVYATSFFTLRDSKIIAAREFFADQCEPPFDRSQWAERC